MKKIVALVSFTLFMCALSSCGNSIKKEKEAAIAKIEKAMKKNEFKKALEAWELIPAEFADEKEAQYHAIKSTEIKYNFSQSWDREEKQDALRTQVVDLYPFVGADYLLKELLKLECFHDRYSRDPEEFREYVEDYSQHDYDYYIKGDYNDCADGWNLALQSIASMAAQDEDYTTANRCLSEFKPIMAMVSRSHVRTEDNRRYYNFKSKLVASPLKDATVKKVQSIKMIKDIEREFNTASFARGSSQLSDNAKAALNKLVNLLLNNEALSVKFIGHTSADGNDVLNMQLSKDRASAAASYLESKGVNFMRIGYDGKGSTDLKNKFDPTSEENCRIEFLVF